MSWWGSRNKKTPKDRKIRRVRDGERGPVLVRGEPASALNPPADAIPPRVRPGRTRRRERRERREPASPGEAALRKSEKKSRETSEETKNEEAKAVSAASWRKRSGSTGGRTAAVAAAETRGRPPRFPLKSGNERRARRASRMNDGERRPSIRPRERAPEPARGGLPHRTDGAPSGAQGGGGAPGAPESRVPESREKPAPERRGRRRPRRGNEPVPRRGVATRRERLMRAQSTRAAKRSAAAKEQTKSVSSSDDAKTSEDGAFEARVRAAKARRSRDRLWR